MPVTFSDDCFRETPILTVKNELRRHSVMGICEVTAKQLKDSEFSETIRCDLPIYVNLGSDREEYSQPPSSIALTPSTVSRRSSLASLLSVRLFFYSELIARHGKNIVIAFVLLSLYAFVYCVIVFCSDFGGICPGRGEYNESLTVLDE